MYEKPKSFVVNSLLTAVLVTFSLKEKMIELTGMPDKLYIGAMFLLVLVFLVGIVNRFPYLRMAVQFIWSAVIAIFVATIIGILIAPFRAQSIAWYIIIIILTIVLQYAQASAYHRYEEKELRDERERLFKKHNWRKAEPETQNRTYGADDSIGGMKDFEEWTHGTSYSYQENEQEETPMTSTSENADWFAGCTDLDSLNKRHRDLLKLYHPDSNNGNDDVSKKINEMYDIEKKKYM